MLKYIHPCESGEPRHREKTDPQKTCMEEFGPLSARFLLAWVKSGKEVRSRVICKAGPRVGEIVHSRAEIRHMYMPSRVGTVVHTYVHEQKWLPWFTLPSWMQPLRTVATRLLSAIYSYANAT